MYLKLKHATQIYFVYLYHLCTANPETNTLASGEDPYEMQYNAAFHQGLHCFLRLKQPSVTEIHHNCGPLHVSKYTIGVPCMYLLYQ